MGVLTCPRRVHNLGNDEDSSEDAAIGTYFHALAAQFYLDAMQDVAVEFSTIDENAAAVEGRRLFQAYREHYSPYEFGVPVGAEIQLPRNADEAKIILDAYGFPATSKPDLVIDLDADQADYVSKTRNVEVEPGIYIVDHKTKKAHTSTLVSEMQLRPQFMHYQYLWDLLHPTRKCKGVLANVIFRYKQVRDEMFLTIQVPPPSADDIEMVLGIFRDAQRVLDERGRNWANPVHCFDYHRPCPLLMSGDCNRTNA